MEHARLIAAELADEHLRAAIRAERKSNALLVANFLLPLLFVTAHLANTFFTAAGVDRGFWESQPWLVAGSILITLLSLAYVAYAYLSARTEERASRLELLAFELRFASANAREADGAWKATGDESLA